LAACRVRSIRAVLVRRKGINMSEVSGSQAKAAFRETLDQLRLSPEQISTQNVGRAAPVALRPRDITIADRDPDDPPITISV
jgi:hypothetical protein